MPGARERAPESSRSAYGARFAASTERAASWRA
jgi:hypothetical protein